MKKRLVITLVMFFCIHYSFSSPVNAILGDQSYQFFFGKNPDGHTSETLRISTHLRYVELYLRSVSTFHLSDEVRKSRMHLLDLLHTYRMEGRFPSNNGYGKGRRPCFIDRNGNICAVGYLVEQTAGRALAQEINASAQYAHIMEMQNVTELTEWVKHSGLTLLECAMIQPEYADSNDGRVFVAEADLNREALTKFLTENISLPDSLFIDGPEVLKVSFTISATGLVSDVKLNQKYPKEFHRNILKAIKTLRFKPAYQMHYIREENRYETENVPSKEIMVLVLCQNTSQASFIRARSDIKVPGSPYYDERIVSNVVEVYQRTQKPDSIKVKGVITDLPISYYNYLTKLRIYAPDEDGEEILVDEIAMQKNEFVINMYNNHYMSLKLEFRNKENEVQYVVTDVKPLMQTLLITLNNVKNNRVVCGGRCAESFPDTKKAWYNPLIINLQTP
jgi:hypothetical protein